MTSVVQPIAIELVHGDAAQFRDLASGGIFAPGISLELHEACTVVLIGLDGSDLTVPATVVWPGDGRGVGLAFTLTTAEDKATVADWLLLQQSVPAQRVEDAIAKDAAPNEESGDETDAEGGPAGRRMPRNVHERLRGLTLVEQIKMARLGETAERMVLERMYGKTVWETLLRNPRITHAEVARIARMGTLPRPQLEFIVGNGAWLGSPEIRRALLSNPRLSSELAPRVLRHLPKMELKLAQSQVAYPVAVREAAKRMVRDQS